MDMRVPSLPRQTLPDTERLAPVAVGLGLLVAGALLWKAKPHVLDMPDPVPLGDNPRHGLLRRAARKSREGMSHIAPYNLGVSIGRSLAIAGGALLITRILDELAGRD